MKLWHKIFLVTVLVGLLAFLTGKKIWPPYPGVVEAIPANLFPHFIFISLVDSLIFGLGIAFVLFGLPIMKKAVQPKNLAIWAYIALAWLLLSWWPHDNLHPSIGPDVNKLLVLEYLFHVANMVAAAVLAYTFFRSVKA